MLSHQRIIIKQRRNNTVQAHRIASASRPWCFGKSREWVATPALLLLMTIALCQALQAFDCGDEETLIRRWGMFSGKAGYDRLEAQLVRHGFAKTTTPIARQALFHDGFLYLSSISDRISPLMVVTIDNMMYRLLCATVHVNLTYVEECYEDIPVVKDGRLRFYNNKTKFLHPQSRQIDCTRPGEYYMVVQEADVKARMILGMKSFADALYKHTPVHEGAEYLFDDQAIVHFIEMEEASLNHFLREYATFVRKNFSKITMAYGTSVGLYSAAFIAFAFFNGMPIVRAVGLVVAPIKLYYDYRKVKKELHLGQQILTTASVEVLNSDVGRDDLADVVGDLLTALESAMTRLEHVEGQLGKTETKLDRAQSHLETLQRRQSVRKRSGRWDDSAV